MNINRTPRAVGNANRGSHTTVIPNSEISPTARGGTSKRPSPTAAAAAGGDPPRPRDAPCRRAIHLRLRDDPAVVLRVPLKCVTHHPAPPHARRRGDAGNGCADASAPPPPPPPPPQQQQQHLFLCPACVHPDATGCPAGAEAGCPDVHADVTAATRLYPHRRLVDGAPPAAAQPPRFDAAAGALLVAAPNEQVATLRVAAGECLATRALEAARAPLGLCAHFLGPKAACDFGAACQFVHPAPGATITVDAAAVPAPHPLRSFIDLVALDVTHPPAAVPASSAPCCHDMAVGATSAPRSSVAPPSTPRSGIISKQQAASTSLFLATMHSASASMLGPFGGTLLIGHRGAAAAAATAPLPHTRYQHDPYRRQGWTVADESRRRGVAATPPPAVTDTS